MRTPLAALAALFLLVHLLHLPRTLEDVDSINFALGVRAFDVSAHQPHPPGYPVFIALARGTTALLESAGADAAAPRGLALLSAAAGALLIPLLFSSFGAASRDWRLAWWTVAVTACSPLFWFTALRPLSDMTGLACAIAVHALLVPLLLGAGGRRHAAAPQPEDGPAAVRPDVRLLAAAALVGLGAGVRFQTVPLTLPLFLAALLWPGTGAGLRARTMAVLLAGAAGLAWGIPMLVLSGGPGAFLEALGTQAGEDFAGVVMLWTRPEPRVAADALLNTFVWPWGRLAVGIAVTVLAALGAIAALWRSPRFAGVLALAFVPYLAFHLLFQETVTMRYALPLVPPAVFLALYAVSGLGRGVVTAAGAVLVLLSLQITVPAARAYAVDGSPAFRLYGREVVPARPSALGMHAVMRRVEDWAGHAHDARVLKAPHGREWLALVEHWRAHPESRVHFLADPRRTDLALFDPHARRLIASARWTLPEVPFVAGTRPGAADLHVFAPPGWMLDRGWALTAEVGGVTAREGAGPGVRPAVAWIRARPDGAALILGGRNLAGPDGGAVRLTLSTDGGVLDSWTANPGAFFRHVALAPGALAGTGYVPLRVSATAEGERPSVSLEQFDVQSGGIPMLGLLDGWHEPEYNPRLAVSWRWMSERARLWVRPIGRDLMLTLQGESPLRYFDAAPQVRVRIAGVEVARFAPSDDFSQEIPLPATALAAAGGVVTLESDRSFTPAERTGAADQRQLALRIYSVRVR